MSAERRRGPLAIGMLAVLLAMLTGCAESREELWRATSPDGRVDAVFVRIAEGGATVGFAYNLFFVPVGSTPEGEHPVLVADRIANLQGQWAGIKRFELGYDEARIFNFFTFWHSSALDDDWLLDHGAVDGVVNVAAPNPLPNAEFMLALREAWGIGVGLPSTRWMLEIGALLLRTETELILKSRRVVPGRLLNAGFTFAFPTWREAAADLCKQSRQRQQPRRSRGDERA